MNARISGISPRAKARIMGVFEALEGATSAGGQVTVLNKFVVVGSAAATATNILAHPQLYWLGFALSMLGVAFHVAWVSLFYDLFAPVNRSLARLALCMGLVVCALQGLTAVLYLGPWLVLTGGSAVSALPAGELQAVAYVFLRLNSYAFDADLVFFGFWCVLAGWLIFRSTFMPRVLGVLLMIDGLGWVMYLSPPFASRFFLYIAIASGLAEISLQLWLLIAGVNSQRWKDQAAAAAASPHPA